MSDFLAKVADTPAPVRSGAERGRLIFALDATASREPTWQSACRIQASMFEITAALGGLDVQLCHYRGFGEFYASGWVTDARTLAARMAVVRCAGGTTQISKVLGHARKQHAVGRVNAVVFVGDCMEEDLDHLCALAGELGLLGVPAFMFQEGRERTAQRAFRDIARLSRGAYCSFDGTSAEQLRELLAAVAVFAAGGLVALEDFGRQHGDLAGLLARQID